MVKLATLTSTASTHKKLRLDRPDLCRFIEIPVFAPKFNFGQNDQNSRPAMTPDSPIDDVRSALVLAAPLS
jgi:hypothetical protein